MLRIRFGRDDLTRVRFMISPLGETVLSAAALQRQGIAPPLDRWRNEHRHHVPGAPGSSLLALVPADWRPSVALAPVVGARPRFDEEIEAVLEFNARPLRAYLASNASPALASRWTPVLPDDARGERRLLADLLTEYHQRFIADHWPTMRAHLEADVAQREGLCVRHGVSRTLATLHSTVRWHDTVLDVDEPGPDRFMDLAGRGLVLVPSVFAWPRPIALRDGHGQPVLLYPVRDVFTLWVAPGYDQDILSRLLGSTRAALLLTVAAGDTTSHLAERLNISIASTSQHLTVLRQSGLVQSIRRGRAVHHDLTSLGVQLVLASDVSRRAETSSSQ
jgi:DNA-binding transcriptional ArsR family regulator